MHLIVHIFKKDVRRMWWGVAGALLLQIAVAYFAAANRPDSPELSSLLIAMWACLIAVAVHEDPLVGDRQFWITRPSPWPIMLGSKLLFAVGVIHVPCFLADIVVLAVRGFHPWEWLGRLLVRQIVIAAGLTLPVVALTAALRSFAHVALSVIAIGGLTAVASDFLPLVHSRWRGEQEIHFIFFLAVLGVAAAVIVPLQYARRRAWRAHMIGVAAVVAAELVLITLPTVFVGRVRAAVEPARGKIAFRLRPAPAPLDPSNWMLGSDIPPGWTELRLPLRVSGIPEGAGSLYDVPTLELTAPGKRHFTLHPSYIGPDWLIVRIQALDYESVKDVDVNLNGAVIVILHRFGLTTSLPVGADQPVASAGRCSSSIVDRTLFYDPVTRLPGARLRTVNVSCESPAGFPLEPIAMLGQPGETDLNPERLQGSSNPWLVSRSPIERVSGAFRVTLPAAEPTAAKLEITPDLSLGWQVVNLDLRGFRLSGYAHYAF